MPKKISTIELCVCVFKYKPYWSLFICQKQVRVKKKFEDIGKRNEKELDLNMTSILI